MERATAEEQGDEPSRKKGEHTRASPSTLLSWSSATSLSGCGAGGGSGVAAFEESSCAVKLSEAVRSKVTLHLFKWVRPCSLVYLEHFQWKLSVTGLSEGLILLLETTVCEHKCRLFSPEAACEVVEKNKDTGAIWRIGALRGMLKEALSLFVMFHGGLAPKTAAVRLSLFRADLFVGKKLQLTQRGTVQMLTLSKDTALEVESLVQVLDSYGGSLRCHSMIVFQHLLVSTTLSRDDTV
ncbi:hypothetical protein IGI04_035693 [Brassica rapa subsp. trilocularis]|uniref:Uncharacterized protein n=1 Tax=Brassica rapa subsp. trilocularis TaxID=1813537 RepID=A0ABQ7LFF8_BRACM|nr:hypothetical protein IGI04_035693 [Brassica rapa subsp. trilocularis]